jgi:hypothetical protein
LPISESPICRYSLSGSEAHPNSPIRATNAVIVDIRSMDAPALRQRNLRCEPFCGVLAAFAGYFQRAAQCFPLIG